MKRHSKYIERNDLNNATHLEISVSYNIGGPNYFRGGITPRGYYLSVKPVTKGHGMVGYDLFSGCSHLLFETKRFSAKQFAQAIEMSAAHEEELIATVVSSNKAA